ncbi:MAG: ABC transporter ATP-binding protein [Bacilli bacterium]
MLFGKHVNKFYKKYFWYFFFGIITLIAVDYIQLFIPEIIGNVVDELTNGTISLEHLDPLYQNIIYILLVGAWMFIGRFLWRICVFGESIRIQCDLREEMFLKTEVLSQRYYKENKTGAILSYFSNDLDTIEESFGVGIIQLVDGVFLLILSLVKMFKVDLTLTLFCLIPLVILCACAFIVDKVMEKRYEKRQKAFEDLSDFAQENFTGIRVIKAFVKEKQELKAFAKEAKNNKDTNINYVRLSALLDVMFDLLIYIIFTLILFGGSYYVYQYNQGNPGLTVGQLITYIGYLDTIIWPIFALASIINLMARGRTSLRRISSLLDEKVEIVDDKVVTPDDIKGDIEFKNFNFKYPDEKNTETLKNINLHIKAGETVGVVGKIGSGKSTLVNMLFRLYNVEDNTLFIDGYDIMHLPIKFIRSNIGYCPQDNFLFSDTIKSNISFSDNAANDEKVFEAADFSDVKDNIEEFKDGYNTLIGEKGVSLSGGQKQRISISRAIIKNPAILVLDDSVSAVDVKTEEVILKNIRKLRKGKTTILIASRVSTVKDLGKILVLKDGEVEAFGTHEECLKNSKTYARMVELQTLEKEMEGN